VKISLQERLPCGLAQAIGMSRQKHQRCKISAATRALRRAAKASTADGAGACGAHAWPSTKNRSSRRS
jgi:hypothetical protein